MADERTNFRRIVVGFQRHTSSHGLRFAAEMASLLQLDLLGLFIEDESLLAVAALPCVREFRPLGGGWRSLDAQQLSRDLDLAVHSARRTFTDVARMLEATSQFHVLRGSLSQTIASVSRPGDIVMMAEAASSVEDATEQIAVLAEAASHSASAVLLVPQRIRFRSGPVVAIAAAASDASVRTAAAIASAADHQLVIVESQRWSVDAQISDIAGVRVSRIPAGDISPIDPSKLSSALHQMKPRLIVMVRGSFDDAIPAIIATTRDTPVLLVAPDQY